MAGECRGNTIDTYLAPAFRPVGCLEQVAQEILVQQQLQELSPADVVDIILPARGETPRWQLIQDAKPQLVQAAEKRKDEIFNLASQVGQRKEGSLSVAELSRINPDAAIFTVESGANRTGIVRRGLCIDAMRQVYGNDASNHVMYQFGAGRKILQKRADGTPNPEYTVAREIAGRHLPDDDTLTEFGLNLASALQDGYTILSNEERLPEADRIVRLHKEGVPGLVLVQPNPTDPTGLECGLTAIARLGGDVSNRQLVIATNGQYRPKDEEQARQWEKRHEVADMLPPVAIGDEPGYAVIHGGLTVTTGNRGVMTYVNELAALQRLRLQAAL